MTLQDSRPTSPPEDVFEKVDRSDLFYKLNELKSVGARILHITGRDIGENMEINYHFELGMDTKTLVIENPKEEL